LGRTLRDSGYHVSIVRERQGIFTTSGRAIKRNGQASWKSFVIVMIDGI
jgi:hypothetical protein